MNNTNQGPARLKWLLLAATLIAALVIPASAQTTLPAVDVNDTTTAAADAPGWVDTVLVFAATLGTKFGVVGKVFGFLATVSGFCALTIKPLWDKFIFPGLTAYVQSTVSTKDDEMLQHLLANKVVKPPSAALAPSTAHST